jgi:hypothetical protein
MLHRHAELRLAMLRSDSMLQSEMLFDVRNTMLLRFCGLPSRKELLQGEMPQDVSLRLLTKECRPSGLTLKVRVERVRPAAAKCFMSKRS